jgi:hypothetical protein
MREQEKRRQDLTQELKLHQQAKITKHREVMFNERLSHLLFEQANLTQGKSASDIEKLIVQGSLSMGIWRNLNQVTSLSHQRISQLDQQLNSTSKELERINLQIQELQTKQQLLQQQFQQLNIEKSQIPVAPKEVKILSDLEEHLEQSFKARLANPNWIVCDIRPVEVTFVLSTCGLFSLLPSFVQANLSSEELAAVIEAKLYDQYHFQGDYLDFRTLELVWDLLGARQFPPDNHLNSCPVCSGNRDDVIQEWKLSMDFSAHPAISVAQLLYVPYVELLNTFNLSARDHITKFRVMKRVHDDFIANNQP